MGLQVIIEAPAQADVERALGGLAAECEIFAMAPGRFGVSVPLRVVDTAGEPAVRKALSAFRQFDLYEGAWREPKKTWRLW